MGIPLNIDYAEEGQEILFLISLHLHIDVLVHAPVVDKYFASESNWSSIRVFKENCAFPLHSNVSVHRCFLTIMVEYFANVVYYVVLQVEDR